MMVVKRCKQEYRQDDRQKENTLDVSFHNAKVRIFYYICRIKEKITLNYKSNLIKFNDIADVNAYIKEQLPVQSDIMKDITGYGIKIMVEPNGDHRYIKAAIETNDISWIICQSAPNEYPSQSKLISDWTDGSMPTTFTNKPVGAWERFFFQSHESTLKENYIDTADETSMILGGTHGITNSGLAILKDLSLSGSSAKKDQFWVGGADEVWEYYYLYNNAKITDISYAESKLTFKVKVLQKTPVPRTDD